MGTAVLGCRLLAERLLKIRLGLLKSGCSVERAWESRAHVEECRVVPFSISHFKGCLDNELGANLK